MWQVAFYASFSNLLGRNAEQIRITVPVAREKRRGDWGEGTNGGGRVVPKSYRPEGQPSSPRTENPSRALVGIVSSIPIWRSISLTKCLNWLSGYGSMKMKSMFPFSLHDRNVLDEVWLPNIKPLSWLWNLYPMSLLLNSKKYTRT